MTQVEASPTAQHGLLLKGIVNRLDAEFGSMFTRETLEHYVHDSYEQKSSTWRVRAHIPAFVDRFARQRLRALAKNRGLAPGHTPHVLFVCERNDAASQMAAALFESHAEERAVVHSAGTAPSAELLAEAVEVMSEVHVDLSGEVPKPITPEVEQAADVIVTLDAHDDIEIFDGKRYLSWRMSDPGVDGLDGYRRLRDQLDAATRTLAAEIAPAPLVGRKTFDDALALAEQRVLDMGREASQLLRQSIAALATNDVELAATVVAGDDAIDGAYGDSERGVVDLIARQQPVATDLRRLVALLHIGLHVERIADGSVDIARAVRGASGLTDGPGSVSRLVAMGATVMQMVNASLDALQTRSRDLCLEVAALDHDVAHLREVFFAELVAGDAGGGSWSIWMDRAARSLERIGDHAVDIAEAVWFQLTGEFREFG